MINQPHFRASLLPQVIHVRSTIVTIALVLLSSNMSLPATKSSARAKSVKEPASAKFEPPTGMVYHGAALPEFWSDTGLRREKEQFEEVAGKKVALVKWFASVYENGRLSSWRHHFTGHLERVKQQGAVSLIQFSTQDFNYQNTKKMASPTDIISGVYDAYFEEFATAVKEFASPVFISLNPEMNGSWYPYSQDYPDTNYTSADYVAMWRHIVDIFRKQGARNAAWVWSPNIPTVGATPFTAYYPGDNYVDWVGATFMSSNQTTGLDTLYATYAPRKPIIIAEWATSTEKNQYNSKFPNEGQWIENFFQRLENRYPRVKAIVWFQWNKADGNYLLQRDEKQQAIYSRHIKRERYIGDAAGLLTPYKPLQR